ncbi:TPA: hypothetical protein JI228_17930 [Acinetobacter baumannii]|nr:hypothetical protein [Acinetobacter baumannii]
MGWAEFVMCLNEVKESLYQLRSCFEDLRNKSIILERSDNYEKLTRINVDAKIELIEMILKFLDESNS